MREKIEDALRASRADYTEIRLEEREITHIVLRGREVEEVNVISDQGGFVRGLVYDRGWGVATFNGIRDLSQQVEQAYENALYTQGEPTDLAPMPTSEEVTVASLERDFRGIPIADKKALLQEYNNILLHYDSRILDTSVIYYDSFNKVIFSNSEGTYIKEERPHIAIFLTAIAREGGDIQRCFKAITQAAGFEAILGHHALVETVARRAIDLLAAPQVEGGRYTVICNPQLAGIFAHEAFGHLSEADFVCTHPKAQEMMVLGRRFGKEILTIVDDGSLPGLRGSHRYDDEGTPTGRTELIKEGVLVGRLHSRETAAKMEEHPTGNARATDYRYPPIVRMTNTFIETGETTFEEMIQDVDLGIYACDSLGGQTTLESFSFNAAYAYVIRDGEIAELVRGANLSGNLFVTLKRIDSIGDDLQWAQAGLCRKGQGGLPVGIGAPHIRIRDVLIGGK